MFKTVFIYIFTLCSFTLSPSLALAQSNDAQNQWQNGTQNRTQNGAPNRTKSDTPSPHPDIIVELFTSQGCSSCPSANKFTAKLARDPEKLILTYGVTYWDYLGWKDTFGQAKFTERQRAYGRALHIGNVYTPQIVLNGAAHSPRYSRNDVETMPLDMKRPKIDLVNTQNGLRVQVPDGMTADPIEIALVAYVPGEHSVDVSKGENRGRTLRLANVVKDVTIFQPSKGLDVETNIRPQNGLAYASLVHDVKSGKIITAARYSNRKGLKP